MESDKYSCPKQRVATIIGQLECLKQEFKESGCGSFAAAVQIAITALKMLISNHKKT